MSDSATRYYAHWITNRATSARGTGWVIGPPRDTANEAKADLRAAQADGSLVVGFVVQHADGERRVMVSYTVPSEARNAVRRHLEMLERLRE